MKTTPENRQAQIDANYQVFLRELPDLLKAAPGKFVVIKDQKIDQIFDTARDAMLCASKNYPNDVFSVQEITQTTVDLGWFSHAPHYAAL